jgi:hypothetical protein
MGVIDTKRKRIDIVMEALHSGIRKMIFRSTKGSIISPRYRIAMFAYSDTVEDLLGGIQTVDQVARIGLPTLKANSQTNTEEAFLAAEDLLRKEIPQMGNCPAPLVCHMTDGEYNRGDPEPVAHRIMQMAVPDGNVLIENIFVSPNILPKPIKDPQQWSGIMPDTQLSNDYARKLRAMSSQLPEGYRKTMEEDGYNLQPRALMLIPGMNPELVSMAFVMSAATPVHKNI